MTSDGNRVTVHDRRRADRRRRSGPHLVPALAVGLGGLLLRAVWRRARALDLDGQVVVITGSSRGLGFLVARQFALGGARLVICARGTEELEQARRRLEEISPHVLAVQCDVADPAQVRRLIDQATASFGRVDVLVNNAGIITVGPRQTQTQEDYEQAMNIMFWGIYHAVQAVLPQMLARRSGRIVNVTSIGGKVSVPDLLPYSCAKFAAVGLSEGLGAALAKEGIAVTTVVPGLMRTGSHVNARFKGRHRLEYALFSLAASLPFTSIDAAGAARQIVEATRRGDPEVVLGPQAKAMALLHGVAPGLMVDILGLVNRLLPGPGGIGQRAVTGEESQSPFSRRAMTLLGQWNPHGDNEMAGR